MAALMGSLKVFVKYVGKSGTRGSVKFDFKRTFRIDRVWCCCDHNENRIVQRRLINAGRRPLEVGLGLGNYLFESLSTTAARAKLLSFQSHTGFPERCRGGVSGATLYYCTDAKKQISQNLKVPIANTGGGNPGSKPENNDGHDGSSRGPDSTSTASRLQNTRQMFKETKEKMKDRVEELILKENIMTIPNMLCLTRIALSPVIGYLIFNDGYSLALGLFVFAGVTDLLDGLIARNFKSQQSMFGSFLDPLADKLLVFTLVIALTGCHLIPGPLTALIIARDVWLIGCGFYIRYVSLPPPKSLSRYFDATLATARLQPTFVSKINTTVQLTLVACTLASPVFDFVSQDWLHALWYVTATTTILSALSYVSRSKTYFPVKKNKDDTK